MRFIKAHAYGNDFLLVPEGTVERGHNRPDLARRMCDRHRGLGADGVMFFTAAAGQATMQLLNADGSRAEVSGNGVRCLAAWLAREQRLDSGAEIIVRTEAGPKSLSLLESAATRYRFRAAMGDPAGLRQDRLDVANEIVQVVILNVGNPQCVVLGPVSEARLHSVGAALAVHPSFPEGTNVELAAVETPDRVRILIWERGVGPTQASGTGACAAAVAAAAFGGASRELDVISPGGTQRVEWTSQGLWLTGWTEIIATGEWL